MDYEFILETAKAASYADLTKFITEYVRVGFNEYREFHQDGDKWNEEEQWECYKDVFASNVREILDEV